MNTSRRRVLAATSVPVAALAALVAGQSPASATAAAPSALPGSETTASAVLSAPAALAAPDVVAMPDVVATPDVVAAYTLLRLGSRGSAVLAAQRRLAALGYWPGPLDGIYGPSTMHAVTALQKVAGLARDGILGPVTARAMAAGVRPSARTRIGDVIEIDLAHQVLLVVHSGRVRLVFDTSTGSGAYYYSLGRLHHAVTPKGTYHVFRSVNGWDAGPLGNLYRPRYFNGGIAVHGYPSVPAWPASHGCVRVTIAAMNYLWAHSVLPIGRTVLVR